MWNTKKTLPLIALVAAAVIATRMKCTSEGYSGWTTNMNEEVGRSLVAGIYDSLYKDLRRGLEYEVSLGLGENITSILSTKINAPLRTPRELEMLKQALAVMDSHTAVVHASPKGGVEPPPYAVNTASTISLPYYITPKGGSESKFYTIAPAAQQLVFAVATLAAPVKAGTVVDPKFPRQPYFPMHRVINNVAIKKLNWKFVERRQSVNWYTLAPKLSGAPAS